MKIDIEKVLIKTGELIALRERVSSAEKVAGDLVLENIRLRNRAIIAEERLDELKDEQAKAVEILKGANSNLGYVIKYLSKQVQDKTCSNCLERYCGNCAHAHGAKVQ
ncbi:hypothetical protein [Serratia bockelmannii]|uniref:hypothetical protein n=1 Tax=Serratia bockelmannii TaxID=2703793 RepID=UPI00331462AA